MIIVGTVPFTENTLLPLVVTEAAHRYAARPRQARRAARRYDQRHQERWNRLRDLVAGAPSQGSPR